ncbi:hypothetical protein M9458_000992, partial [Cirrhinus mrigala]
MKMKQRSDLERDSRTFTLDAPGSVSEKTQIVAAAKRFASASEDKRAALPLRYPSIPSAFGL